MPAARGGAWPRRQCPCRGESSVRLRRAPAARCVHTGSERIEVDMHMHEALIEDSLADAIAARVEAIQWPQIETELEAHGAACVPYLLQPDECRALKALYADD